MQLGDLMNMANPLAPESSHQDFWYIDIHPLQIYGNTLGLTYIPIVSRGQIPIVDGSIFHV